MTLNCPACGAEVDFKSKHSVFAVCSFCASTLVRHDVDLESLGKMAELPPDMSVLQVGTQGRYEGKAFELLGRLKIAWEDGTWNEWFALFEDGREGWLAEAMGFTMMSFAVEDTGKIPPLSQISVGKTLQLGRNQRFSVDDVKDATCVGSEGELPFKAPKGRKAVSVDLSGPGATFANLEYSDDGVRLFIGRYAEFPELKLTNLRKPDGW